MHPFFAWCNYRFCPFVGKTWGLKTTFIAVKDQPHQVAAGDPGRRAAMLLLALAEGQLDGSGIPEVHTV